eukprot:SAG31_NODE_3973_length_3702_cov_3.586848_3_plen_166_part_00
MWLQVAKSSEALTKFLFNLVGGRDFDNASPGTAAGSAIAASATTTHRVVLVDPVLHAFSHVAVRPTALTHIEHYFEAVARLLQHTMHIEVGIVDPDVLPTTLEIPDGGLRWISRPSDAEPREIGWLREEDMAAVGLTTNMRKVLAAAKKCEHKHVARACGVNCAA